MVDASHCCARIFQSDQSSANAPHLHVRSHILDASLDSSQSATSKPVALPQPTSSLVTRCPVRRPGSSQNERPSQFPLQPQPDDSILTAHLEQYLSSIQSLSRELPPCPTSEPSLTSVAHHVLGRYAFYPTSRIRSLMSWVLTRCP
jgi:hypothetical protein